MSIEDLESYLLSRIQSVTDCYEKELPLLDVGEGHKIINISNLSKKEKEEVINKRNCLLIQKYCFEEILGKIRGDNSEKIRSEQI